MAKSLKVEVIGDPRRYMRALHQASSATSGFGRSMGSAFRTLGKTGVLAFGAVSAAAGFFAEKSVKQAIEAQAAQSRLTQALKNQGIAMTALSPQMEEVEKRARELGFSDDDAREAVTKLIQAGKGWKGSLEELTIAQDYARASGLKLSDATTGLIRLQAGNIRAAKQYGIVLPPVTAAVDALKKSKVDLKTEAGKELLAHAKVQDKLATGQAYYDALTKKVQGQGEAFSKTAAGGMARFHASLQNLEEQLGGAIAPVVGRVASALGGFFEKISQAPDATAKLKVITDGLGHFGTDVFNALKTAVASVDWNRVWEGIKLDASKLTAKFNTALQDANWDAVGKGIGDAIVKVVAFSEEMGKKFTDELAKAARNIDWSKFALALGKGIMGSNLKDVMKNALLTNWKLTNPVGLAVSSGLASKAVKDIGGAFHNDPNWADVQGKVQAKLQLALVQASQQAAAAAKISAGAAGTQVGASMAAGIAQGLLAAVTQVGMAAVHLIGSALAMAGQKSSGSGPWQFTRHAVGKPLAIGVVEGFKEAMRILGPELAKAIAGATKLMKPAASKGMNEVGMMIIAAAKKYGIDAKAALAVAMTEGGIKFGGPAGDSGHSFGPFQMATFGELSGKTAAQARKFADSVEGINFALRRMAEEGAKGAVGLEAIRKIVGGEGWGFERPKNAAAEVAKAWGYFKTFGPEVSAAIESGGGVINKALTTKLEQLVALVKEYGPKIGLAHTRAIIASLVGNTPDLVAAAKAQMEKIVQAMAAAARARTELADAFRSLAEGALAAFDEVTAAWEPKAQKDLDKMQLEDQVNAAVKGVADAQTAIDAAQAKLDTDLATPGIDPAQIEQDKADLQAAIESLGAAQRSYDEFQLGLRAIEQRKAHERQRAADREDLSADLIQLQTWLKKHPGEYAKTQEKIMKLMKKYHIPLFKSGQRLAQAFAAGLNDGLMEVVKAARKVADAIEDVANANKPRGGKPTTPGTAIGGGHGAGVGGRGTSAQTIPGIGTGGERMATAGATTAGPVTVNVTVQGALLGSTLPEVAKTIGTELRKMSKDNARSVLAT